jgi:hypothetical protein
MTAAKHVLRYLKGSSTRELRFSTQENTGNSQDNTTIQFLRTKLPRLVRRSGDLGRVQPNERSKTDQMTIDSVRIPLRDSHRFEWGIRPGRVIEEKR